MCCNKQSSPNLSTVVCGIDNIVNNRSIGDTFPFHVFAISFVRMHILKTYVSFIAFLPSTWIFRQSFYLHLHKF